MEHPTTLSLAPRELDRRSGGGIDVALLWTPGADTVVVSVVDSKLGHAFEMTVAATSAAQAFRHPFAYAAEFAPCAG